MTRLIDADNLTDRIVAFEELTRLDLSIVHDFVGSQPTVDAVQVIRCKDCKWMSKGKIEGAYMCLREKYIYITTDECGYCSWAKRKEE